MERLAHPGSAVCDLFAGSGTVSLALSERYSVTAVDVQESSRVLCSAVLHGSIHKPDTQVLMEALLSWRTLRHLRRLTLPLIEFEEKAIHAAEHGRLEALSTVLEGGSLAISKQGVSPSEQAFKLVLKNFLEELQTAKLDDSRSVCLRHYGGSFFSYAQAAQLDGIASFIRHSFPGDNLMLAALLSTASHLVNTIGNQFAQPLRPRDKQGRPKQHLIKKIRTDRRIDAVSVFLSFVRKYLDLPKSGLEHQVIREDYANVVPRLFGKVDAFYADPPYTRDHYSRFYHVLETLSLGDDPILSKSNLGGGHITSRGSYRVDRHQSAFCIKSQAPGAFTKLFRDISDLNAPLLLSYSGFDPMSEARPRVLSIKDIIGLAQNHFSNVHVDSVINFRHSKLNKTVLNKLAGGTGEVLLSCY